MKISFLGAAGTVTGSKYLLEYKNRRILIDCGLFQGLKELRQRNWESPIDAKHIDAVILTHAHLDHSGYIPLLVKNGFRGRIYCSPATKALCDILLPDSGYLQEEDAYQANHYRYSNHKHALPLYTAEDAKKSLEYFYPLDFEKEFKLWDGLSFTLNRVGHIFGASYIYLKTEKCTVLFSGDVGRLNDPVMKSPSKIKNADYLVVESTYGDRLHSKTDPCDELEEIINSTVSKGGSIVIPAFAVGRAQSILYYIHKLKAEKKISNVLPVFLDSPMAINATQLLHMFSNEHKMDKKQCKEVCSTATYLRTAAESKSLNSYKIPAIIISASGMATGGRVLHHLKRLAPDRKNTIILAGFQAAGTRGARLLKGEKELRIHGEMIPVHARIESLGNVSAHADYSEMLEWLSGININPKSVFITHGEEESAKSLKQKVENKFGWNCIVPAMEQSFELGDEFKNVKSKVS